MQEPLGGAAGQHASGAAGVRGADDDEVSILTLGELVQPEGGGGAGDGPDLDRLVTMSAAQALEQLVAVPAQVLLEPTVLGAARVAVVREDVDEHELRAGDSGQAARQGDGVARALGLVDAHDDLAHDRSFSRWLS
ncbi:MAG: hypothetical protein ABI611_06010 [Solirubrobacteraceae bacterium]